MHTHQKKKQQNIMAVFIEDNAKNKPNEATIKIRNKIKN